MPELLTPGVFIQEVDLGPQPIEGVSTSTGGFVGETERGQEGAPTLVTSFADYQRKFGGFLQGKFLPLAIRGFFDNGGRRAFIVRAVGAGAAQAHSDVVDGYEVALLATLQPAATAGNFVIRVASVVGLQTTQAVVVFPTNGVGTSLTFTIVSINAGGGSITATPPGGTTAAQIAAIKPATHAVRFTTAAPGTPPADDVIRFLARDKGLFANGRLKVLLTPVYVSSTTVSATTTTANQFVVSQIAPFAVGQTVEIELAAGARAYPTVTAVDPVTSRVTFSASPAGTAAGDSLRVTGWQLDVFFDGTLVESIPKITSITSTTAPDNLSNTINSTSAWVRVDPGTALTLAIGPVTSAGAVNFPFFKDGKPGDFTGGSAGTVSDNTFIGVDLAGARTGLKALEVQEGVSIIAVPGQTSENVIGELIGQAERKLDRFAVFESANDADIQVVLALRGQFNSRFGAMYHPWLQVLDPVTDTTINVPPSGHIIGAYARTDNDRGVFKAPANVTVRGVSGFARVVPDGEQDLLNPAGVNVLRTFEGLGNVIWGARTISAEGLWKYVPVRRLFIFIEQSIVRGTRFAVFEPNDQRLWAKIRDAVVNFLTTQWRAGALFGAKPEEAFFVRVDETTTTQDDRDNGRVNIIVGIAPVKPAEFIVFQIGQAPSSVIIAEQGG